MLDIPEARLFVRLALRRRLLRRPVRRRISVPALAKVRSHRGLSIGVITSVPPGLGPARPVGLLPLSPLVDLPANRATLRDGVKAPDREDAPCLRSRRAVDAPCLRWLLPVDPPSVPLVGLAPLVGLPPGGMYSPSSGLPAKKCWR
ncbi:hypothetical protein [Tautonia marina]|uniref:hypothetical protein n=1 Tax=Tautonia marina TaxID=2653855 RepID=UPI001F30F668|nr:hypothetical protein [Tautonia marina]